MGGLDGSIWASQGYKDPQNFARVGDWNCPSCGFSNFQWRSECLRCATSKTSTAGDSFSGYTMPPESLKSQPIEFTRNSGNSYGVANHAASAKTKLGLVDSIWAARNRVNNSQIWIKKRSEVLPTNGPPYTNSHPPNLPDLGLPYEVQHFILSMIQRILEEGCYDYAYRWIPRVLNARGWSCAEAVELSAWRDFLPTAVPANAVTPVHGYSLSLGLKDAVKIRNSAVHRHLCDNPEIRRMAQQAEDLMTILGDVTRQNKFRILGLELRDWDRSGDGDQQTARAKLELALQQISERPVDGMDWTPNAVSLQEITLEAQMSAQDIQYHGNQDYGEPMEVD